MATSSELDKIYETIDTLFQEGKFEEVNQKLKEMPTMGEDIDILLGYLTVSLSAADKLSYRSEFYHKVEKELRSHPEYTSSLLQGLN
tara:strand:+ start:171 stop:431 length:261 start_codon:yes stop_codon:yes gene_type:complete